MKFSVQCCCGRKLEFNGGETEGWILKLLCFVRLRKPRAPLEDFTTNCGCGRQIVVQPEIHSAIIRGQPGYFVERGLDGRSYGEIELGRFREKGRL